MRPPLIIKRLHRRQRARLKGMYRQTRCPRTRIRILIVLLSDEGYSVEEIAQITHQSDDTVRRWLHRFMDDGYMGLYEAPHTGRPPEITLEVEQFLRDCLLKSPRDFSLPRPTWTTETLATVVKRRFKIDVTDECIRQHLGRLGAVCRRPTWTVKHLAQKQPGYAQKKGQLQDF